MLGLLDRLDEGLPEPLRGRPEALLVVAAILFLVGTAVHAGRFEGATPAAGYSPFGEGLRAELAPDDAHATLPDGAVVVGPTSDTQLPAYLRRRQAELLSAAAGDPQREASAIVSFGSYEEPESVDRIAAVEGVRVVAARWQLRVPGQQEAPPTPRGRVLLAGHDDLAAVLEELLRVSVDAARAEAEDLEAMAADAGDSEFAELFHQDAEELRAAADAVVDGSCPCVYAIEVEGILADLVRLADSDRVRLVDYGPPEGDDVVFLAVLPEDTVTAE